MIGSNQIGWLVFIGKEFLYLPHSLAHSVIIEANLNKNFQSKNSKLDSPKRNIIKLIKKSAQQNTYNMLCVKTNIEKL